MIRNFQTDFAPDTPRHEPRLPAFARFISRFAPALHAARFWIALVMLTLISLALATVFGASHPVSGGTAVKLEPAKTAAPPALESYEGVITDTRCGARHSAEIARSAADCTRACVHAGEQFILVDGDALYQLDGDLQALKRVAGQRVKITGKLSDNRIDVASISAI